MDAVLCILRRCLCVCRMVSCGSLEAGVGTFMRLYLDSVCMYTSMKPVKVVWM